mmetsp:Transcript_35397/g.64811  ORF Transcript_35397/g.64811 Transcript_35397/m.64811 type:complete len:448 (-) Transcript_35397:64-1407(-)
MLQYRQSRSRRRALQIALVAVAFVPCHVAFNAVHAAKHIPRRPGWVGVSLHRLRPSAQSHAGGKCIAHARKQSILGDFKELTKQAGLDIGVAGAIGSLLSWSSTGVDAALGFACGSLAAAAYTWLLVQDVSRTGASTGTPFDPTNMLRPLRLLLPVLLALSLASDPLSISWPSELDADATVRFYSGLLGFIACLLPLRIRGLFGGIPDATAWASVLPGSIATAVQLGSDMQQNESATKPSNIVPIPVLVVSGPNGFQKDALVKQLLQTDRRFARPTWLSTGSYPPDVHRVQEKILPAEEYEELLQEASFAVSLKMPRESEDDEEARCGITAASIVETARQAGACVLDVDTTCARQLLENSWASNEAGLEANEEVRIIAVWVSLATVDKLVESKSDPDKDPDEYRREVLADMEWALTTGHFDFTVVVEDEKHASKELQKAASYCFASF